MVLAAVAQWLRRAAEPKDAGSNPGRGGRFSDGGNKWKCLCVEILVHVKDPQVVKCSFGASNTKNVHFSFLLGRQLLHEGCRRLTQSLCPFSPVPGNLFYAANLLPSPLFPSRPGTAGWPGLGGLCLYSMLLRLTTSSRVLSFCNSVGAFI